MLPKAIQEFEAIIKKAQQCVDSQTSRDVLKLIDSLRTAWNALETFGPEDEHWLIAHQALSDINDKWPPLPKETL